MQLSKVSAIHLAHFSAEIALNEIDLAQRIENT
jgi:hypothetical protein